MFLNKEIIKKFNNWKISDIEYFNHSIIKNKIETIINNNEIFNNIDFITAVDIKELRKDPLETIE